MEKQLSELEIHRENSYIKILRLLKEIEDEINLILEIDKALELKRKKN